MVTLLDFQYTFTFFTEKENNILRKRHKTFITKPRSQMRGIYAMMLSICLSVLSSVACFS